MQPYTTAFPSEPPASAVPLGAFQPSNMPPVPAMLQAQVDAMNEMAEYNMEEDHDSAYDSESLIGDDSTTLASYITDYRFENGRRYHAYRDGAYWVRKHAPCCKNQC